MHFTTTPRSRRHTCGFTLIELLTVIAIIGILAAILIPTVGAVRGKAKAVKCSAQLRSWGTAVRLFANDNKGRVALLINLSGTEGMRFYDPYFPKGTDGATGGPAPSDYMSICPSVDRSGQASSESNRRYYNFVEPNGCKTAKQNTAFASAPALVKDVQYYTIEMAKTPSRLVLMMETIATSDAPLKATDSSTYNASMTNFVMPVMVNSDPAQIRHGGSINVLFLDGHVSNRKWADLDINALPAPQRGAYLASGFVL